MYGNASSKEILMKLAVNVTSYVNFPYLWNKFASDEIATHVKAAFGVFLFFVYLCIFSLLLGLIGNAIIVLTIYATDLKKKAINKYVLALLGSDLLFNGIMICMMFEGPFIAGHAWLCHPLNWLGVSTIYVSSTVIMLMTLERIFAVLLPLVHLKYRHINRWWIIVPCLICILMFTLHTKLWPRNDFIGDVFKKLNSSSSPVRPTDLEFMFPCRFRSSIVQFLIITMLLPFSIVLLGNLAIYLRMRFRVKIGESPTPASNCDEDTKNANRILLFLPVVFVVPIAPMLCVLALLQLGLISGYPARLGAIMTFMIYWAFNYVFNWVVYALVSLPFRQTFVSFWSKSLKLKKRTTAKQAGANKTKTTSAAKEEDGTEEVRLRTTRL